MLEKIKEIKDAHPLAFWLFCIVIFPAGVIIAILLLYNRFKPADRDVLDQAAKEQGKAEAAQEQIKEVEKEIARGERTIKVTKRALFHQISDLKRATEALKEHNKKIEEAKTWEEVDKEAGVK